MDYIYRCGDTCELEVSPQPFVRFEKRFPSMILGNKTGQKGPAVVQ